MSLAPLVISGAPRSGTTLIYTLFDSHPDIAWLVTEGYLFEYLYDLGPGNTPLYLRAAIGSPERLVEGLRDREMMPSLHLPCRQDEGTMSKMEVEIPWSEERFWARLRAHGTIAPNSLTELWRILARAYLSGRGAEAYMDDSKFRRAGVEVVYQNFVHPTYRQSHGGGFVPGCFALEWPIEHPATAVADFRASLARHRPEAVDSDTMALKAR